MRCCRDWNAAASKEPTRVFSIAVQPTAVAGLSVSPLRRHVAELDTGATPLRLEQLRALRSLPRLTALTTALDGADLQSALLAAGDSRPQRAQLLRDALPLHLRTLTLAISNQLSDRAGSNQALLDALPAQRDLTELLLLKFDNPSLDVLPLRQMPALRHLTLETHLTQAQCAELKEIPTLTSIDYGRCAPNGSERILFTPPHRLQRLERLDLRGVSIDLPALDALLHLPALRVLQPGDVQPECWGGLGALTQLHTLSLHFYDPFTPAQLASLGESLSSLPRLSDLDIVLLEDADSASPALALRMPALRRLILHQLRVPSLEFIRHSPRLELLRLHLCADMSAADVMASLRAHPPPRLHTLELFNCVPLRLSDEQWAALQPPSALLPQLENLWRYSI